MAKDALIYHTHKGQGARGMIQPFPRTSSPSACSSVGGKNSTNFYSSVLWPEKREFGGEDDDPFP